jgi:hypothetical protein
LSGIDKESEAVKEVSEPRLYEAPAKPVIQNPPSAEENTNITQPAQAKNIANEKNTESPAVKPTTVAPTKSASARTEETTPAANPTTSVIAKNKTDKKEDTSPAAKSTNEAPARNTTDIQKGTSPASTTVTAVPAEAKKDVVIYRVQILANTKPIGSKNFTIDGKSYRSFEYLYMGGYRTTIGECQKLAEATALQNACRRNGYNQAFVVAFINNIRSNDPALFK